MTSSALNNIQKKWFFNFKKKKSTRQTETIVCIIASDKHLETAFIENILLF